MKSELSWLIDLVLMEECPANIRKLASTRIREVEKNLAPVVVPRGTVFSKEAQPGKITVSENPIIASQSPSMQKIMMENPDLIPKATQSPIAPPQPTTPAAAMALAHRQQMISKAVKGEKAPK